MKNKKKITDPALKQILAELEEVVERLGYKTRYEKGNFEHPLWTYAWQTKESLRDATVQEQAVEAVEAECAEIGAAQ